MTRSSSAALREPHVREPHVREPHVREPQQARAIRTREALLEAGARAFSSGGYAATTAKTIAGEAGVATGTFYQYFADKDALLREIAAARLARVGRSALASPASPAAASPRSPAPLRERVRHHIAAMIDVVSAYHRDDPGLHAVLTERRHADPQLDALTSQAERVLVERVAEQLAQWSVPRQPRRATPPANQADSEAAALAEPAELGDPLATAFVLFGMVEGSIHAHVLGARMVSDARFTAALTEALLRVALPADSTR